jgi:NADH-quinone oxidoreductase subunit J
VALVVAFLLLTIVGSVVYEGPIGGASGSATQEAIARVGQVQAIGLALYTDYLLAVELAAVLMLVGLVGALVLTQRPREDGGRSPREGSAGLPQRRVTAGAEGEK